MRAFEIAKIPFQLGIQPIKWAGSVLVDRMTQTAPSNIVDVWRHPWEAEVEQHLDDAKEQRDFMRADEQRSLLECIHQHAPHTAEEFEELRTIIADKPRESQLDEILGPTASPPPED